MESLQSPALEAPRCFRLGHPAGNALAAVAMMAGLSGCLPEAFLAQSPPPDKLPCRIATRWDHDVHFPPDTLSGDPLPTIAGRLTLFAEDLTTPVSAEGIIGVYMYDDMPDAVEKNDPIEVWFFHPKDVRKLLRRDAAGWGYTLILPWQKYRPDLTHVKMKVRFDRTGAQYPLYSEMIPVTFESANGKPRVVITQTQTSVITPSKGLVTQSMPGVNAGTVSQPRRAPSSSAVDQSGGGSLPTTITLSPPPPPGNDVPFIVPSRDTMPRQ